MTVAETSLEALRRKRKNGSLETDKEKCLHIIDQYGPITSEEMELHMGKNKHRFSGRINDLKESKRVKVVGTKDGHQLLDIDEQPLFIEQEQDEAEENEDLEAGDVIFE